MIFKSYSVCNEFDEPVISSSGRKRKIKAEMFSRSLAKAARCNGERKALCTACNHIHTVYDHNKVCQASTLHCHLRRLLRLNKCFLTLKHEMWSYLLLPKKDGWSYLLLL